LSSGLVVITAPPEEREQVLAAIPPLAARIQVRLPDGKVVYRKIGEVEDSDEVCVTVDGKPVVMFRPPGRPNKGHLLPVSHQVADIVQAKDFHLIVNDLVKATQNNPEADSVFNLLMQELSKEITRLDFTIQELDRRGKPSADISSRRVRAIKQMSDAWLKRKERTDAGNIDLDSFAFQHLFKYILETFRLAVQDAGTRPEQIETIFSKLSNRLSDGWNEEAKLKMKGS